MIPVTLSLFFSLLGMAFAFVYLVDISRNRPEEFTIEQFLFIMALFLLALRGTIEYYLAFSSIRPMEFAYELLDVSSVVCIVLGFSMHMWGSEVT